MKQFMSKAYGAAKLAAKAHGPTIMVIGGVGAMGIGTIVACKKTLQLEETLVPHVSSLDDIAEAERRGVEVASRHKSKVRAGMGYEIGKLYAVPAVLFVGGTALVFGGHHIMLKRNATLALAFTGLKKSFDAYRARATEAMGPEFDQAMMNGWKMKEVRDEVTGETAMVPVRDFDAPIQDPYARVFEEGTSSQWENDLGVNKMFIHGQQKMANILLNNRGYLYLNEVYVALGMAETDIGQVCGWKVRRLPDGTKEIPFVDFGLNQPMPDDWKYGPENAVYLNFNCHGLIVGGNVQKMLEKA